MADPWANAPGDITGPITNVVTPTLDTALTDTARALWVGVAGDVSIVLMNGNTVVMPAVAAGVWHPIRFTKVNTSGTTATSLRAGY